MDEPIISPWLIYLIGSVDGVLAWVIIIGLCSLALAVACFIESTASYYEEDEKPEWRRRSKIFLIVSIIFISLFTRRGTNTFKLFSCNSGYLDY